ncbi:hypothetical protein GRJ2_003325300 [Grus japonensis]|uniref:Uncharacterized protein n=1 Tax=Grus japonensis TaxID=30415 RepID=A0ABC9YFF2_GRUJA
MGTAATPTPTATPDPSPGTAATPTPTAAPASVTDTVATQTPVTGTAATPTPMATPVPATDTVATQTLVTGTEGEPENQPVPVSVAPIQKKKYTKKSVRLVKDDDEPGPSQEEEPEPEVITRSLSLRELRDMRKDFSRHPGKWTTMERGIQYLRELAVRELVYYDPDNAQLPTDPDEVQCTRPMWQKFVRSAPSSYANSLAVMDWKSEEAPTVDEVAGRLRQYEESLSSSLISAVEKLSREFQQLREDMSYSPPVRTSVSAIQSKHFSPQERGYRGYTPRGTLWFYLCDHGEDMRKWDGKPTSMLQARVHELQSKTATKGNPSRKNVAPVSSGQFPRPSGRPTHMYDPLEGTSKSFLQEVSSEYDEQD